MADTLRDSRWRGILRLAWLFMLGCVVAGSLAPKNSAIKHTMDSLFENDKVLHWLAYFLLALLPALHERRVMMALQVVAALFVGVLLEFGQRRFSGRPFDAGDLVANAVGVLVAVAAAAWLRPKATLVLRWGQPNAPEEGR